MSTAAVSTAAVTRTDWRTVPVPARMKALPLDPRGYPIFAMAFRDNTGRAHFTVNDGAVRLRMIREDRCSICNGTLLRGRWFIGGDRSAFDPRGAYIDPPMHSECAHYALQVCPYLAAPAYASLIHGRTVPDDASLMVVDQTAIDSPETSDEVRPHLFVAVLTRGQRFMPTPAGGLLLAARPYIAVEYWQHGRQLPRDVGEAMCREIGVEPTT
jgi:hypothetical protein